MDPVIVFAVLAGIIFIGFLSELIFKHTNIPDVLLLILLGIIIGPVLEYVDATNFGDSATLFTTFALVFILFQGALSVDFKTLFKSLSSSLILTVLTFLLTAAIVSGIGIALGYAIDISLLMGVILGGTSSAVVIPLVKNIDINEKYGLVLTLESAISDVLCIIGTLTILEVITDGQFVASGVFNNVLSSFSLALVVGAIVGIVWVFLLKKFDVLVNAYMMTIAILIGLYAFVESPFVEASGAIAALAFGLILGNSKAILNMNEEEINEETKKNKKAEKVPASRVNVLSAFAKNFYAEISFFVKVFFFVYLGLLMDFSNPLVMVYGAVLTLGIYLIRPLIVHIVFKNDGYLDDRQKTLLEALIPKGLAAAVLAQIAVQSGVLGDIAGEFVSLILTVILMSIILTSIIVFITEKGWFKGFYRIGKKQEEEQKN